MLEKIKEVADSFVELSKKKEVVVISHNDTDGITSASIMTKCLKRLDIKFQLKIVKSLSPEIIYDLPKDKIILFLDLASNSLQHIEEKEFYHVFIIDHHEISQTLPKNVTMINPHLYENQEISSAGLCYLFAKSIDKENKDLANLAVIGMIGDMLERTISKSNNEITKDAEIVIRHGLMLYPATRPLNKVLEYSSEPYIPEVTGNPSGVMQLLREAKIEKNSSGQIKSLIELDEEEMARLVTSVLLRRTHNGHNEEIIGNLFLVKHFNKLEDARELSAKINATSRQGESHTAVLFCLEDSKALKRVESLYVKYKQAIIDGLNIAKEINKIEGRGYMILNAENRIKDTIIGVIISILSNSALYPEGTVLIGLARDNENKRTKISARLAGRKGRNLREILEQVMQKTGGEFGGHHMAAGCNIDQDKELEFLAELKSHLELELVKI